MRTPGVSAPRSGRISGSEWLILLVLAAVQFTHIVDFMIIMPLGDIFIQEMSLDTNQFGTVVAAYTWSAGIASLFAAQTLDRFGRKRALLTLYAGFGVGTFLCGIAPNYWWLVAARAVAGGFGGVAASVVFTVIGDVFPFERRGQATGVVMSAFSLASITGVPLGIWLADQFGWHIPFFALAGVSVIVLSVAAYALPAGRGHLADRPQEAAKLWQLATNPRHVPAYALTVTLVFGTFSVVPFLAPFLKLNVGFTPQHLQWMYAIGGVATIGTLVAVGKLTDRVGKLPVFRVMAGATIVALLLVTNLSNEWAFKWIFVATTFMMVATSGRMVPATAMITSASIPAERAGFLSVNSAVQHIASGAAAKIGGMLLTQPVKNGPFVGYPLVGLVAAGVTFISIFLIGKLHVAPGGAVQIEGLTADTPDAEVEMTGL